jgi:FdhD protein
MEQVVVRYYLMKNYPKNNTSDDISLQSETFSMLKYTREGKSEHPVNIAIETPVTLFYNDEELVTLLASPGYLDYLAAGYLSSEGIIETREDILQITVDKKRSIVRVKGKKLAEPAADLVFKRVITTCCGRGPTLYSAADIPVREIKSKTSISIDEIFQIRDHFQHHSRLFISTRSVHSAGLYNKTELLVFHEDISRHNALDRVFGNCLLNDLDPEGRIIVTSGRVPSDMMYKISRRQIPIVISMSAPTNMGIKIALELGVTLLSIPWGNTINVYTNSWRIKEN